MVDIRLFVQFISLPAAMEVDVSVAELSRLLKVESMGIPNTCASM